MTTNLSNKLDWQGNSFKVLATEVNARGRRVTEKAYTPGIDGAREWFNDFTAEYISGRMQGIRTKQQKPTLAQQRLLGLLGLEVPMTKHMAEVMLGIAGYDKDAFAWHIEESTQLLTGGKIYKKTVRQMTRSETRKLSDAGLLQKAKR